MRCLRKNLIKLILHPNCPRCMKKLAIVLMLFLSLCALSKAQKVDPEKVKEAVDSKTFVFLGRQATGTRGRSIQLDPGYTLNVRPEKVVANLPFFGRAYSATPGSTDGGLKFDLTDYTYEVNPRKKGGWDITIEPTGSHEIRSIFMTIQESGYASLRITSNGREGMSYSGILQLEE